MPLARVLMIQGTCSDAGKSTVAAGLCRVFSNAGYRVAPFKAQNMSNNAAVVDGGEIGRAQAVQARAARVEPTVDMNPVLLKPQGDRTSQVVVHGKPWRVTEAREYYARKAELWPAVTASLDRLREAHDLVIIEGAGSPAEINLAQYDIVNMRVARYAGAPVLLVGDIDRGGVFASLYGTHALLTGEEQALVRGFVINKFRGDPSLLTPGFAMLEARTGVPILGVLPYLDLAHLPAEDGMQLDARGRLAGVAHDETVDPLLDIAVLRLPRIANLDEFQPLANEPGVSVRFVRDAAAIGTPDLVIIPGTKSTMADLAWVRERGLDGALMRLRAAGTPVLGICGGYQMLGVSLHDPDGVDGTTREAQGLGLLPMRTTFSPEKVTERVHVRLLGHAALWQRGSDEDAPFDAYEIHMGRTSAVVANPVTTDEDHAVNTAMTPVAAASQSFVPAGIGHAPFSVAGRTGIPNPDGATSADGQVVGTYLHGLFENTRFRHRVISALAARKGIPLDTSDGRRRTQAIEATEDRVERAFDALAASMVEHLDMDAIRSIIGMPS